jgi:NADPH:quinone reductase-like Zn-dependent oxidoreductase
MFENMAAAIGHNRLKPVIDRRLDFSEVPDAMRLMQQAGHFGKIAINFPPR